MGCGLFDYSVNPGPSLQNLELSETLVVLVMGLCWWFW